MNTASDRALLARLRDELTEAVEAAERVTARDAEAATVHAATEADRAASARLAQQLAETRKALEQAREQERAATLKLTELDGAITARERTKRDLDAEIQAMKTKIFGESVPA